MIIPIRAIGRENICEITNVKRSIEIDVHNYKNSISRPERLFIWSVGLCVLLYGDNGRGKKNIFFQVL